VGNKKEEKNYRKGSKKNQFEKEENLPIQGKQICDQDNKNEQNYSQ